MGQIFENLWFPQTLMVGFVVLFILRLLSIETKLVGMLISSKKLLQIGDLITKLLIIIGGILLKIIVLISVGALFIQIVLSHFQRRKLRHLVILIKARLQTVRREASRAATVLKLHLQ